MSVRTSDFLTVTELAGDEVSDEQLRRVCHRYYWAEQYVAGRDVLEVACGSGMGLGFLARRARSLKAGDLSPEVLSRIDRKAAGATEFQVFDAQELPYSDGSFDVVILFEALYYIPSAERFVREAKRVLRPSGVLLIATANKDLYDFSASPFAQTYYGVVALNRLLATNGFQTEFFGYLRTSDLGIKQRLLRPVKMLAALLGLIPKTMQGKVWLKRLIFGTPMCAPGTILNVPFEYSPPDPIGRDAADRSHKVIYCVAQSV